MNDSSNVEFKSRNFREINHETMKSQESERVRKYGQRKIGWVTLIIARGNGSRILLLQRRTVLW